MDQIFQFFNQIISWFSGLSLAEKLGVIGFILSSLISIIYIIKWIAHLFRREKRKVSLSFKLEDVTHEMFKKKGFVTFDLYVRNDGDSPIEILQSGLILADGTEIPIYEEPHKIKAPDNVIVQPGHEAFYDNCDLFQILNVNGVNYKKIVGFYADVKGAPRFRTEGDIHPLMNDQIVRGILTDKKGLNGF